MAVGELTIRLIRNCSGAYKANCSLSCTTQAQTPCLLTRLCSVTTVSSFSAYKLKGNQTSNFILIHEAEQLQSLKQSM